MLSIVVIFLSVAAVSASSDNTDINSYDVGSNEIGISSSDVNNNLNSELDVATSDYSANDIPSGPPGPPDKNDLNVTKKVNNNTPLNGKNVVYNITVKNKNNDRIYNVKLTDTWNNPKLIFVSANTGGVGSFNNVTGVWTIGTLNGYQSVSLILTFKVNGTGNITNNATASAPGQKDSKDSCKIEVKPSADLSVNKTVNNTKPYNGQNVLYTIVVKNNGPDKAVNAKLSDLLNSKLIFVSANTLVGSFDSNTGLWTIGDLANGAEAILYLTFKVNGTGDIVNKVNVSSNTFDPCLDNNNDSKTICANASADLSVKKSVNNTKPYNGQNVLYTIVVKNNGPDKAVNAKLSDLLNSKLIFVSANTLVGSFDSNTGLWTIGDLANGAEAILYLTFKVNGTGDIVNKVNVSSNTFDPNLTNNNDTKTINSKPNSNLSFNKSANVSYTFVGDLIKYTITIKNIGDVTAYDIYVIDKLPKNLRFISANPSVGYYDNGKWIVGDLEPNDTAKLIIIAEALEEGLTVNTAELIFDGGSKTLNASFDVVVERNNHTNDTNTTNHSVTNNTVAYGDLVPMKKTAIPVSVLFVILALCSIFGIIRPKIKK